MMRTNRSPWAYFDWPLLVVMMILCGIGVAMIYSATRNTEDVADYWQRQCMFFLVGLVFLFIIASVDYRYLEVLALPSFFLFVALLLAVFFFGNTADTYAKRWITIAGFSMQPTELGKFLIVVFMAWYLSRFRDGMGSIFHLLGALILLLGPLGLVYLQPDLGMTITMAFIGFTLIFVSGVTFWQVIALGASGIVAGFLLQSTLQDYMLDRITAFMSTSDSGTGGFDNVEQALIAVGSGGLWGRGWLDGTQNQLAFLRVRHSDFIFSVIAEELGLIGSVIILVLFFFVIWRLLRIADLAPDHFGRLLAFGVAAIVFFQVFVNVGMNIRLMPVTGLTLPFISSGGSSLVSMMAAIGLAQSVAMRQRTSSYF